LTKWRATHTTSSSSVLNKLFKKPSSQTLKAIIVSSAHATHDTYSSFIAPLLPFLIDRLSLSKTEAGLFVLVYQGVSILQPIIGHIGDRTNLRKFALLAPAVTGIFLSLLGTAPSLSTALIYCLIGGISSATLHATLPALVSSLSGKNIGRGMSIWMIGGELGIMVGPLLVTAVISTFSIEATPWLMLGGILASIALSYILKDLPGHNGAEKKKSKIPFRDLAAILLPMAGIAFVRSPLRATSITYMPVFLLENGASLWAAGIIFSLTQGVGLIGTISGGPLSDRIGYRITMILAMVISSLSMIAFTLTQGIIQIVFLCLQSIATLVVLPIGLAVVQRSFPENRSLANGIYLALLFAINALAGVATGFMYDQIGGQQTFFWSGVLAMFGAGIVLFLPKEESLPKIT